MLAEVRDGLPPSSDGQYVYPLIKHRSETRLVRLHPGSVSDHIKCDIIIGRLEDLAGYESISYTWADETGDSTKCRTVYVESRYFLVTSNCEAALRRIRLRWSYRTIWMDAISISQDSNQELVVQQL
jgi:Heterokaryon incompatibility protein (HET)